MCSKTNYLNQSNSKFCFDKNRKVRLINGSIQCVNPKNLVGYCNNRLHPGYLTVRTFKEHKCHEKKCKHFYKSKSSPYWLSVELKKKQKKERKEALKSIRSANKKQKDFEDKLHIAAQRVASEKNYPVVIVGIRKIDTRRYRIHYISNHPYDDWYYYLKIARHIEEKFHVRAYLKHVRDENQRYVTIERYYSSAKRKKVHP